MAVSDISALDSIIKRVGRQTTNRRGEYYISIKAGSDEIFPSIWSLVGGEKYIYRVLTEDAGQPLAQGESNTIHVVEPESDNVVNLVITFQAFCPNGNEIKLVQALGQNGNPSDEFRTLITAWARTYLFEREQELFANFESVRDDLLNFISENVTEHTGLEFRPQLRLRLGEELRLHRIEEFVEVRFKDTPNPQKIMVQCDLDIDPKLTLRAIVAYHRLPDLRARLIETIKDYFRREVPAQAFVQALRNQDIVNGLRQRFDDVVVRGGRQVTGLTITPYGLDRLPPLILQEVLKEQVRTLGRDIPIVLTSKIQLTLEDLAQFQKAQITNLLEWLKQKFDSVIQDVCFEKRYIDYLEKSSWEKIEATIKSEMEIKAKEIGYHVKQIFSRPELKENEFKESKLHRYPILQLQLKSTAPVYFDLTVAATFAILDWKNEELAEKINQGVDLKTDITSELHHALAAVLVTCPPNDFILKFGDPRNGGASIEAELKDAIKNTLEKKYQAQVSFVSVDQVDTDDIKRVRELLNIPKEVEFDAIPYGGGESVKYRLTWKISSIDQNSWSVISRQFCNLENIQNELQKILSGSFSSLGHNDLRYETAEAKRILEEKAEGVAKTHVQDFFGLTVSVSNLRRDPTKQEQKVQGLHEKQFDAEVDEAVDKIVHTRTLRNVDRKRELEFRQKSDQLVDIRHKRLAELLSKPDRNRLEEEELSGLQKIFDDSPYTISNLPQAMLGTSEDKRLEFDPARLKDQFFHRDRVTKTIQQDEELTSASSSSQQTTSANTRPNATERPLEDLFFQIDPALAEEAEDELSRDHELSEWAVTLSIETAGHRLAERINADSDLSDESSAVWELFKEEFFQFLCTRNPKYAGLRKKLRAADKATKTLALPAIAGAIGAALGLSAGILAPFVALGLLGAAQLGANAWCTSRRSKSTASFTFPNGKPLTLRKNRRDANTRPGFDEMPSEQN